MRRQHLVLLSPGGDTIYSLLEDPAAVEPDGPRERGQQPQELDHDPLAPPPPACAKNQDFIITDECGEEKGRIEEEEEIRRVWMCMTDDGLK